MGMGCSGLIDKRHRPGGASNLLVEHMKPELCMYGTVVLAIYITGAGETQVQERMSALE